MGMRGAIRGVAKKLVGSFGLEVHRTSAQPVGLGHNQWDDISTLLEGDRDIVVMDVGANVGQTSLLLASRLPPSRASTIYAFEPSGATYDRLVAATSDEARIRPIRLAFGSAKTTGMLNVHQASDSGLDSLLPDGAALLAAYTVGDVGTLSKESVTVSTLDTFAAENAIESIGLLKVDTQGFDLEVLKGAEGLVGRRAIKLVYVEVNFVAMYEGQSFFEDIYLYLVERGYRLVGLYNRAYGHTKIHLEWCDALFIMPHPQGG